MQQAGCAHALGQPVHEALADQAGRFRSDVARRKPRTAGRDDKVCIAGVMPQCGCNQINLIGDDRCKWSGNSCCGQQRRYRGSGEISLLPTEAAIADGKDRGAGISGKRHTRRLQEPDGPSGEESWRPLVSVPIRMRK